MTTTCPCGIAREDCDYHREQPKLAWTETGIGTYHVEHNGWRCAVTRNPHVSDGHGGHLWSAEQGAGDCRVYIGGCDNSREGAMLGAEQWACFEDERILPPELSRMLKDIVDLANAAGGVPVDDLSFAKKEEKR